MGRDFVRQSYGMTLCGKVFALASAFILLFGLFSALSPDAYVSTGRKEIGALIVICWLAGFVSALLIASQVSHRFSRDEK